MAHRSNNGIGPYLDLGIQFAVAIAIGVGLGYFLDGKLNTFPLFLVLGLLLGATSGFLNIYRAVFPGKKMQNKKEKHDAE